ncbi:MULTISPECIES: pilus assembly protein TadG-related protein [unclassified Mesorhizobium]|uniref:pilus assembly protein TadG-related protein n=1 Tax=unclassified Mesorhizobium TaxID=325217 RepID=UPI001FE0480D|nr:MULTISPECIES: pilus assembly protein TadG-related protein [unclassified Mesorhizobium]
MSELLLGRIGRVARSMLGDSKANFTVMTALCAPFALALAAFAIDEGSIYVERREAQTITDLAAITAASNINNIEAAVVTTLGDNGMPGIVVQKAGHAIVPTLGKTIVSVTAGRYSPESSLGVDKRFEAGKTPYNAVHVALQKIPARYFASSLIATPVIGTQAVASIAPQAMFSVGSRLLSVNGGILNSLLSGLLGGNISLSVMDYNALIAADVNLLSFFDALAVQLQLTGVSYSEVLASKATVGQIATAMADVSPVGSTSKLALQTIASRTTSTVKIRLNHLVDLGSIGQLGLGQKSAGFSVDASAMGILTTAAALANGSKQVELNLGATIPGLVSTTLAVAIGEPAQFSPWLTIGEKGAVVRTAQTRIKLVASVGGSNATLGGGISLLAVKLPLHVEVASAEAKLTDISCPTGHPDSLKVSIAARPSLASLHLGASDADNSPSAFADFSNPQSFQNAEIAQVSVKLLFLTLNLIGVNGSAAFEITNTEPTTLTFNSTEIANKTIKTASTKNLTQSLTTSLVNNLSLSVSALGLGLDVTALLGTVKPAVVALLNGVTAPVDELVYNVLAALGVRVGEADVRVLGATCGRSVLVQ